MKIVVFDTETTGLTLHPRAALELQPRIIEFAAAIVDGEQGGIVEEYSALINPDVHIDEEINRITGITDEMVRDAPRFEGVVADIADFFRKADAMLAHNFEFDDAMLRNELRRARLNDFPFPKTGLCTVQLYAEEWGRNPRLTELYERKIGHPLKQTHRALDDVRALCAIVIKEKLWEICRN